jgi:hypothetical protein
MPSLPKAGGRAKRAILRCLNIINQKGWQIPAQLELSLQKQQLEKKLLEWSMNGVTQKSLFDSIERQIEQIEAQLPKRHSFREP